MNTKIVLIFFIQFLYINTNNCIKVLGVFPIATRSHYFLGNELLKGIAEAGHDVTIATVHEDQNPPKNGKYRQIIMKGVREAQLEYFSKNDFSTNAFGLLPQFHNIGKTLSHTVLNNTEMQKLINSDEKFDVVITTLFGLDCIKALAPHFDAHLVIFTNNAMHSWVNPFVGNPGLPSITPEILLGYPGPMDFWQRLVNTLFYIIQYISWYTYTYPIQNDMVHKYISKDIDLYKTLYNVSLILANSHISLNKAHSKVPTIIDIAGFHVKPPKKLPEDLQRYMDEAKDGVIYFSMGTFVKESIFTPEKKNALFKAFSKRKEKVLWKFENQLPGAPENVRVEKWFPQSDILAHPNVKVFITHGGYLSSIETVCHGVPTIAMPTIGDQYKNSRVAEHFGYTLVLDINQLTEESISTALEKIISNKTYHENVKHRSKIFHDRRLKPLDEAVYWLEYIVKHNGAQHLKVDYLHLTWYQWYLLDVFAFIIAVIFTLAYIVKQVIRIGLGINKKEKLKKQ